PVGADQRMDRARPDLQVHLGDGDEPLEFLRQILGFDDVALFHDHGAWKVRLLMERPRSDARSRWSIPPAAVKESQERRRTEKPSGVVPAVMVPKILVVPNQLCDFRTQYVSESARLVAGDRRFRASIHTESSRCAQI